MLYPKEDITHKNAIEFIEKYYTYAMIVHDKDVNYETGETKKEHVHVVLEFKNARYVSGLAKELNIDPNYIQVCMSFDGALSYLIHFDEMEKYQYSIENVSGSLKVKLKKLLRNIGKDECDKVNDIFDIIDGYTGYLSLSILNREVVRLGLWDVYRRGGQFILKYLEEHNYNIVKERKSNDMFGGVFDKAIYQVDIDDFFNEFGS
jgi:hypothetical protein